MVSHQCLCCILTVQFHRYDRKSYMWFAFGWLPPQLFLYPPPPSPRHSKVKPVWWDSKQDYMLVSDTLQCQVLSNKSCRNISSLHFDVTNADMTKPRQNLQRFLFIQYSSKLRKKVHLLIWMKYLYDELHTVTPVGEKSLLKVRKLTLEKRLCIICLTFLFYFIYLFLHFLFWENGGILLNDFEYCKTC